MIWVWHALFTLRLYIITVLKFEENQLQNPTVDTSRVAVAFCYNDSS